MLGLVLSLLVTPGALAKQPPELITTKEVKALIQEYGPLIVFHPEEEYFLDMPEAVLNGPSQLVWGLVENEDDYDKFQQTILGSVETSADTLLADVALAKQDPNADDPAFRYWLNIDKSLRSGHLPRAKTYVRVRPEGESKLDLQFWFFSPYNGPVKGKAQLVPPVIPAKYYFPDTVGRHTGDWEHVTLRFEREQNTRNWSLEQIFLSQHGSGQWLDAYGGAITYSGSHPMIYAAKDSHAHYASPGEHPFQNVVSETIPPVTLTVDLVDLTGNGKTFQAYRPGNYSIVSSAVPGVKATGARDWLYYDGLWGEYETLTYTDSITIFGQTRTFTFDEVRSGPTGPAQKPSWELGD
jgi:hypothetical protein